MSAEAIHSDGNVFADLGFPDAGEHQRKAWIVAHILRCMKAEGLTRTQAAERMGLKQLELSSVLHGKFASYSVDRLAHCLSTLGGAARMTAASWNVDEDAFSLSAT